MPSSDRLVSSLFGIFPEILKRISVLFGSYLYFSAIFESATTLIHFRGIHSGTGLDHPHKQHSPCQTTGISSIILNLLYMLRKMIFNRAYTDTSVLIRHPYQSWIVDRTIQKRTADHKAPTPASCRHHVRFSDSGRLRVVRCEDES